MSEGEVAEQLVQFINIVLMGVSLIFTVVSAYVVALNYFIGSANFPARLASFLFITLVLALLVVVLMGAQATQSGLIARLQELKAAGQLTAAGKALLANSSPDARLTAMLGGAMSLDGLIRICIWSGLGFIYLALGYLTFFHRWTPDAIPIALTPRS